ncbi:MAG: nuclear transport factor 2 family protein [Xanthobacteraceae bacterium]
MTSPEAVVQRQLDAYNARDIDALMTIYAADEQMFEHPAKLLASGSAALRERFLARFKEPNLYAQLLKRVVMGNTVIDHERVTRTFPEGPGTVELVMIYKVENEKIAKAWVIAGAAKLDGGAKTG